MLIRNPDPTPRVGAGWDGVPYPASPDAQTGDSRSPELICVLALSDQHYHALTSLIWVSYLKMSGIREVERSCGRMGEVIDEHFGKSLLVRSAFAVTSWAS